MESIWNISLLLVWAVVLVNLLLTLRLVRWRRAVIHEQEQAATREAAPELAVDTPAPAFRARTLTGELVRLATYTGHSVLFLFVSPRCGSCRLKLPLLTKLRPLAKERSGVDFVLVSDVSAAETYAWVESIREEDKVEVDFPILLDPQYRSGFMWAYNPRGMIPYFCLIDAQGIVQARGLVGTEEEWSRLQREWEGPTALSPFLHRYR
ncbi:redoxin domain-containing protein [Ktedonosporobacter rubrisoli]|uniref:Redoxin domain-containing protein n=1 Tax=Ktedonosporobacter rubrisoli TaxID=2509675 RepID=A0A4P6JQI9_KTERU|nr:redoxin family protein [Ktedonosporobacter rubrisoli]QBD77554.1 redoxin domain-containing protein [Ktedonosporobacter rubrisoli]